jgi:hypothetical protein
MILYIIRWTLIYITLIFLLHNLYLFFQKNLTITRNKDYYNTYSIELEEEEAKAKVKTRETQINDPIKDPIKDPINDNEKVISNTLNSEFKVQMNYELNDFISKIK